MKWPQRFSDQGVKILSLLLLLSSCTDVNLKKNEYMLYKANQVGMDFCTTQSDTIRSNLKFMFIVDRSGSNQLRSGANGQDLAGTDPNGIRRFDAIIEFVRHFQADPFVYWSMVNFASQVLGGNNFQEFTNNKANFENFVTSQRDRTQQIDEGGTNYQGALDRALTLINEDIEQAKSQYPIVTSNYVIFFVSDGEPKVNQELQDSDNIINRVRTITTLEKDEKQYVDGIQINTAYYYADPVSPDARLLLNDMSLAGNGDFLEFADGQAIDFSRFAIPLRISKFDVKEVWVTNVNTVWQDNILKMDSDGDGLSDDLEAILGSDPQLYDSDGNGVGDGVEYRISGGVSPCQDVSCSATKANPYTTCRSLEQPATSATKYADADRDFLNDCEEKLLDSDPNDPDTNHDYIPDDLAFKNGIKMNESSNAAYLDPDYDQLSDYQELKYNTPARVNNASVPGYKLLRYTATLVSSTSDQDCYHFDVTDLVTRSNNDKIRVYLMENTKTLDEKRIMRTAEGQLSGGNLYFLNEDFK